MVRKVRRFQDSTDAQYIARFRALREEGFSFSQVASAIVEIGCMLLTQGDPIQEIRQGMNRTLHLAKEVYRANRAQAA